MALAKAGHISSLQIDGGAVLLCWAVSHTWERASSEWWQQQVGPVDCVAVWLELREWQHRRKFCLAAVVACVCACLSVACLLRRLVVAKSLSVWSFFGLWLFVMPGITCSSCIL